MIGGFNMVLVNWYEFIGPEASDLSWYLLWSPLRQQLYFPILNVLEEHIKYEVETSN